MSTFIHSRGRFISFSEFLQESFNVKPTKYGNNLPNFDNKYISDNGKDWWTFTKIDDVYVLLVLQRKDSGLSEIGFGSSVVASNDFDDYVEDRLNRNKALKMFNSLFFIFLKIIEKSKAELIFFNPADDRLGKFYSLMVKNKSFLNALNNVGYEQTTEPFTFKKK